MHIMLGRTRRIHLVGVGGSGMSGIAELLVNLGYSVSGSDLRASAVTERLASLGVRVYEGHATGHVGDADVVVVSSAVRSDNPEIVDAQRRDVPVIPRAEMLAELMRLRSGIAVAGAHGKTTTTSMIAVALERAGLDPTALIGGCVRAFGSNARIGRGEWMVVEADESDRSFLALSPKVAVITNIDREHLDRYRSFDDLVQAFVDFANRVPFYGAVVLCANNDHLRAIRPRVTRRVVTYGLEVDDADVAGHDVCLDGLQASCTIRIRLPGSAHGGEPAGGRLCLRVPGRHNLENALAALAVGVELGVPFETMARALAEFHGAERRFQVLGEARGVTVVDDYGHHPTEIRAVIAAARSQRPSRLIVVFQPHRYTRTQQLLGEFGAALREADHVVVTEIYAAGEDPIAGITAETLARAVRTDLGPPVDVVASLADVPAYVASIARRHDWVVMLGAGSIGAWGTTVLDAVRAHE